MTRRTSRRKYLLLLAAVLIPVAAILKAYGRAPEEMPAEVAATWQQASLTVSVERVRADTIPVLVTATGSVEAWQEAAIGAESGGLRLTEVLVAEGDRVNKGEVIARLDDSLLKAELAEQKAAVEQARATLEAAETASARAEKLLSSKAISTETAEEKATTVKTSRAQLAQAQAAAERTEVELRQTEIRAPFDGFVSTRPASAGSIVQTGTELMKIIRGGRLEVAVLMPEKDLLSIAVGQAAAVTDASGRTREATVSSVAEKVDGMTRLGTVYVSLGAGSGLKPGMFARVSIETAASRSLSVAESALVWRDGKPAVFVLGGDGTVTAKAIETGARKDSRVAVASGLSEGDTVVVAGAGFLNDGNLVRVSSTEANTATGIVR